jgi:hypothetical protein
MAEPQLWSGVTVAVQSALATALPVSAVTKANPGVASYTGTDPTNGDFVYFSDVAGMTEIDQRVVRVANVNAGSDTFELEGINTTAFGTFTSGNASVITFGTTLAIILTQTGAGGEAEQIDVTTIHDRTRKVVLGAFSPLSYTGTCVWDPSDAGFIALKAASEVKGTRALRFTFPNGSIMTFAGQVGFSGLPTGSAQGVVETAFTITARGNLTTYAS